jgi:hypothetical protein
MEYKFLEMLTVDFVAAPEEIIRQVNCSLYLKKREKNY